MKGGAFGNVSTLREVRNMNEEFQEASGKMKEALEKMEQLLKRMEEEANEKN